ncbi:MAG: ABC transporter permease [Coprobacillaceae bacterium]
MLSVISIGIGVKDFDYGALINGNTDTWNIAVLSRIPRLVSILVTGASLSIAGLIMQTITRNKFVSPSTAGTMEWCRLGILIAIIMFGSESSMVRILVAFLVSLGGTLLFMKVLSKIQYKDSIMVPLIGMMMGNVVSSITTFFAYRYDIIQNMSSWLQGNFSLIIKGNYEMLYLGIPFLFIATLYAHHFTIAGMGESFSKNLGLNHERIVMIGLIIVSIVTSVVVVSVGSIAFVGLIIPNLISMYKGDNIKSTIFDTAMLGAIFILVCDMIGRGLIAPYEIPISVIVSVVGSILFLGIIFRRKQHG